MKYRHGYAIFIIGMIALIAFCGFAVTRPPKIAHHVTREASGLDLPEGAKDVCYYIPSAFGPVTAYEFSISQPEFLGWAKSCNWDVQPISEQGYTIIRYTHLVNPAGPSAEAKIKQGYYYQSTKEDVGVYVAYDTGQGRAYYLAHTR